VNFKQRSSSSNSVKVPQHFRESFTSVSAAQPAGEATLKSVREEENKKKTSVDYQAEADRLREDLKKLQAEKDTSKIGTNGGRSATKAPPPPPPPISFKSKSR